MIPGSRRSPSVPTRQWPASAPLLACYHGLDSTGSTDVGVSTLMMDRLLGRRVPLGLGFLGQGSWAGMDNVQNQFGPFVGLRDNVIVSTPLTMSGTTLAAVAAGGFDSYFTNVAQKILALGFPFAIWRIGWEFNGSWYAWKARNVETDSIAAWRRVAGLIRAVCPTFQTLWNPDKKEGRYASSSYADPPDCYPGDDVVTFIGIDAYNGAVNGVNMATLNSDGSGGAAPAGVTSYPIPTQVQRWNNELVGVATGTVAVGTAKPFCLAWCAQFAGAHGKRIIIPEWGTGFDGSRQGENTGDDAYYVQQMAAWLIANNVYAHGYWDRITNDYYPHMTIYDSATAANFVNTNARAAFAAAFGG